MEDKKEPILRLERVTYAYPGSKKAALRNISVSIDSGERIAVLGGNGAGKSTFFLCCNGVVPPTQGKIMLQGKAVGRSSADLRRLRSLVGFVFQDPDTQMIGTTVEEEVAFGPLNLRWPKEQIESSTSRALENMGLTDYRRRAPYALSGGEKKRVSIADILSMEPQMMLLDEPTAALDHRHTTMLEQTLQQLSAQGMALVVSTHDVNFAWRWAQRGLVLCNGELIADGPLEDIFEDEALLERAGIGRPLLLESAQIMLRRGPMPHTIKELKARLEEQNCE